VRKLAIMPTLHSLTGNVFLSPHHNDLFNLMEKELGFEFVKADHIDIPSDVDTVITFKSPQHSNPDTLMELAGLGEKVRLITYFSDLQDYGKTVYLQNMRKILNRSDVILTCFWTPFKEKWPEFVHKAIHVPYFFSPHNRYCSLPFNDSPTKRCLLTGAGGGVYPIRAKLGSSPGRHVDVVDHPGYRKPIENTRRCVEDDYAKKLNKYLMGIATSSIFEYVVGKYFEIPATGSLLLCNEVPDLKLIGFKPNRHYVQITIDNVYDVIEDVVNNPDDYTEIRKQGMDFVRKNHSIKNCLTQIREIIDK